MDEMIGTIAKRLIAIMVLLVVDVFGCTAAAVLVSLAFPHLQMLQVLVVLLLLSCVGAVGYALAHWRLRLKELEVQLVKATADGKGKQADHDERFMRLMLMQVVQHADADQLAQMLALPGPGLRGGKKAG